MSEVIDQMCLNNSSGPVAFRYIDGEANSKLHVSAKEGEKIEKKPPPTSKRVALLEGHPVCISSRPTRKCLKFKFSKCEKGAA